MTVPISSCAEFGRNCGLTVAVSVHDTTGVAVCNQVRSFDIEALMRSGNACYIETLDALTTDEVVLRVLSIIDPEN